jgi:hypothetical protein
MNRDVHLKVGGDVMITLPRWTWTCTIFVFLFIPPTPMLRDLSSELTHVQ